MSRKIQKKKVSKTSITKILKESAFDPKNGGPLNAVMLEHADDPRYLESRAIEIIREMQLSESPTVYAEWSQKAIWLLAVARAVREL